MDAWLFVGTVVVATVTVAVVTAAITVYVMRTRSQGRKEGRKSALVTAEMLLVIVMLLLMTLLIGVVYLFPAPQTTDDPQGYEFRRQVISLLIAAFGAWIGAGAAYFFGRENLRVAADSILAMKEPSPRERLRSKTVAELRPRQIPWTVKVTDTLDGINTKLAGEKAWFIPVVEADGRLSTVLTEDDLWRYATSLRAANAAIPLNDVLAKTVAELATFVTSDKDYRAEYVTVTAERTAADASDQMNRAEARLAIVVDEGAKPTGFLTTGDIRRLLLAD